MAFTLNGEYLGEAFGHESLEGAIASFSSSSSNSSNSRPVGFYPAFSLEQGEALLINIGHKPFQYPPAPSIGQPSPVIPGAGASAGGSKVKKGKGKSTSDKEDKEDKDMVVDSEQSQAQALPCLPPYLPILASLRDDVPSHEGGQTAVRASDGGEEGEDGGGVGEGVDIDIDIDSARYAGASALRLLEAAGGERLRHSLTSRGLKAGGTVSERAARLLSIRGKARGEIDKKLLAKNPAPPCPAPPPSTSSSSTSNK